MLNRSGDCSGITPARRVSISGETDSWNRHAPRRSNSFLREIGTQVRRTTRVVVGGAIALILHRLLSRATTDIDLVDEVPPELRASHELLDSLNARFGLRLTHFQSHYLPTGWASRTVTFGRFGNLDVALIDVYDSFVGKLFSRRDKDRDDLRVLYPQLDRRVLIDRVASTTAALRSDPKLLEAASHNWYVLFGEAFPGTPAIAVNLVALRPGPHCPHLRNRYNPGQLAGPGSGSVLRLESLTVQEAPRTWQKAATRISPPFSDPTPTSRAN